MDYSLLVGIHNLDQAAKEKAVNIMTFFTSRKCQYIFVFAHMPHIYILYYSKNKDYRQAPMKMLMKWAKVMDLFNLREKNRERIE